MSKFRQKLSPRFLSLLAWGLIRIIGLTGRFRVAGYEHVQKLVDSGSGFIMATWHGRTFLPIYYCRGMGIWAITSLSKDGEIQTQTISRLGYRAIRGSTGRGAVKAALSACKKLEEGGILALTPDGPKGPPNEVQQGIIFMAQRAGCPIIPVGVDARPKRLMNAWDSYLLPALFARCALVFGNPINVADSESWGCSPEDRIKATLDDVQQQAQNMVEKG